MVITSNVSCQVQLINLVQITKKKLRLENTLVQTKDRLSQNLVGLYRHLKILKGGWSN